MYLCISLFDVNKCLFLTVNKISEKTYREYVIISMCLKASLQDSLTPVLAGYDSNNFLLQNE